MPRDQPAAWALALGLALACQPEAAPAKGAGQARPRAKPRPSRPEAAVDSSPERELCQLILDRELPLIRAFILTSSERLIGAEVRSASGTLLEYLCPDERGRGELIGMRADKTVINAPIEIGTEADGFRVRAEDVREGLPQMRETTRMLMQERWPDMVEAPARATGPRRPRGDPPPPAPAKIPVTFRAHQLFYVRLRVGDTQLVLNPNVTRELAPGSYALQVQIGEDDHDWKPWGRLEVEAGKSRYEVKLLDGDAKIDVYSE